jgi:hypothetical protein
MYTHGVELLNPADRLESIIMRSSKRHASNNYHLESLAKNAMQFIETEHDFVKLMHRIAVIVQGDDPDWQDVAWDSEDADVVACRESVNVSSFEDGKRPKLF